MWNDAFIQDLEVDGDEFAFGGFDEVAGVGVGDVNASDGMEPAVVAVGNVALGKEPIGDFLQGWFGAIDIGLGNDESRALLGGEDAVEPDVVAEDAVAGDDVAEIGDATLCAEIRGEGEFDDPLEFLVRKDGVLGLAG